MPYKKPYNGQTINNGPKTTPVSAMGHQGSSATIPVSHFMNKPTGKTPHPAGKTRRPVSGPHNHA